MSNWYLVATDHAGPLFGLFLDQDVLRIQSAVDSFVLRRELSRILASDQFPGLSKGSYNSVFMGSGESMNSSLAASVESTAYSTMSELPSPVQILRWSFQTLRRL